jgi:hypothetical protein
MSSLHRETTAHANDTLVTSERYMIAPANKSLMAVFICFLVLALKANRIKKLGELLSNYEKPLCTSKLNRGGGASFERHRMAAQADIKQCLRVASFLYRLTFSLPIGMSIRDATRRGQN